MNRNINKIAGLLTLAGLLFMLGCEKYWEDHYNAKEVTVDENVWDAVQEVPEFSEFVKYMKEFSYDTLFLNNDDYTLFIPDNAAFSNFEDTAEVTLSLLDYHISSHFIQSGNIEGLRKIQTFAEKFVIVEKTGSTALFDGIPIMYESPLYRNGKYFTLQSVGTPKPNLYEFFEVNNPVLNIYIDLQDSLVIDKEKSRPLGYDSAGNTIYDTVAEIYNKFEAEYFPVSEEFRNKTATIVFPLKEDYENALTEMAQRLGGNFIDFNDIPLSWQEDILIPHLLDHGVFQNQLEDHEFMFAPGKDSIKLKNILGDSIVVTYRVRDKSLCSNGYAYNYEDFTIPDSLYLGSNRFEGEWLLETTGLNKFGWKEEVNVSSDITFSPVKELIPSASNDSIMNVTFTPGYSGGFTLEFRTEDMFPGKFLMVVSTHMDIGGIYDIYVNDALVRTFDYYAFQTARLGVLPSVVPGLRYVPEGRFNRFDCWVESIVNFGSAKIKFDYKGPGNAPSKGLIIDYIDFIPAEEYE